MYLKISKIPKYIGVLSLDCIMTNFRLNEIGFNDQIDIGELFHKG